MLRRVVFDTAGFLSGMTYAMDRVYTIPEVIAEVRDSASVMSLDLATSGNRIILQEPTKTSLKRVREVSKNIGEYTLSLTDLKVAALALDLGDAVVFTDDYSLQNLLLTLKIEFTPVKTKGITRGLKFHYRCARCNRTYGKPVGECKVCGGEVIKASK